MPDLGLAMENESELDRENMKTKKMERDRKRDWVLFWTRHFFKKKGGKKEEKKKTKNTVRQTNH